MRERSRSRRPSFARRSTRADGRVTFTDAGRRIVLAETSVGHRLTQAVVQDEHTFHVQQLWQAQDDESLYGLGQRQEGKLTSRDTTSISGSATRSSTCRSSSRAAATACCGTTRRRRVRRPPAVRADSRGEPGRCARQPEARLGRAARRAGDRRLPVPGVLQRPERVWLDGALQVDHYKQNWATEYDQFKVRLTPASATEGRQRPAATRRLVEDARAGAGHVDVVRGG